MQQSVIRTYLEMRERPGGERVPTPEGAHVEQLPSCPAQLYRQLYAEVGRQWGWLNRLWWTDEELTAHLGRAAVRIRVLHLNGAPAGFYELVSQADGSVEIGYFGLMSHAIGQGLGRWLLGEAVGEAWSMGATRVWLHTCTLDHPQALPNYLKRGFVVTGTEAVGPPRAPET